MAVANYHEDYAAKAQQRALMEAAPCPLCQMKVTPENWQHHFAFHHPGETVLPFPVKETLAYADGLLPINRIRTDGGTQPRAQMNPVIIESYAEDMREGVTFPAVVVYYDGSEYWLADGFHRMAAAKEAGLKTLPADIHQGTRRDAVLFSVGANATHGLRRTNEDKRRAVSTLLRDDEWAKWSDREIARHCLVHHDTVSRLRKELSVGNRQIEPRTVLRNGTTYVMNTAAIGKSPVIPFPVNNDEEPQAPYTYNGGYAYCKYCYTIHEDWRVIEAYLWQCERCEHNTHDKHMDVRSSPYDREVVTFCKSHGIDEVNVIQAWQAVFDGNPKAWKEAQRGYICGLDGTDIAVEDADATAVLISADEEAYERAMRQREHIRHNQTITVRSESNEWYTPIEYIEAARRVMGSIDTDPASCEQANQTVKATTFYTAETNGLDKDYPGNVWLNPPYGGNSSDFVKRVLDQHKAGTTKQAVILVNANSTDTQWFAPLWDYVLCFTNHRIDFVSPEDKKSSSTHGSCFIYLGTNEAAFYREFAVFGAVIKRWTP